VCEKEREREREREREIKFFLESYEFHQNMSTKISLRSTSHSLTICLNHVNISC